MISSYLERFQQEKLEVDDVRNRADLRSYLAFVARQHVTLELGIQDFEVNLEQQFNLAPLSLRNRLTELEAPLRKSKDIYQAAISKSMTDAAYPDLCAIRDIEPRLQPLRQCSADFEELYADASAAHKQLTELFASEWVEWKTVDHGATVLRVPAAGKAADWVDIIIDPGAKVVDSRRKMHM